MVWHELFVLVCHWKRTDGGVALWQPVPPPLSGCLLLVLCRGMHTTPFKAHLFTYFSISFTSQWPFHSSAKLLCNKGKPRQTLGSSFGFFFAGFYPANPSHDLLGLALHGELQVSALYLVLRVFFSHFVLILYFFFFSL